MPVSSPLRFLKGSSRLGAANRRPTSPPQGPRILPPGPAPPPLVELTWPVIVPHVDAEMNHRLEAEPEPEDAPEIGEAKGGAHEPEPEPAT